MFLCEKNEMKQLRLCSTTYLPISVVPDEPVLFFSYTCCGRETLWMRAQFIHRSDVLLVTQSTVSKH